MTWTNRLVTLVILTVAVLLFAFGYAVHENSIRTDSAHIECIRAGSLWTGHDDDTCYPLKDKK